MRLRACIAQTMAREEMKVTVLLTMPGYDFEMSGVRPTGQRVGWTEMDTVIRDTTFQQMKFEAMPRHGIAMVVRREG